MSQSLKLKQWSWLDSHKTQKLCTNCRVCILEKVPNIQNHTQNQVQAKFHSLKSITNSDGSNTIFSNIERTRTPFFEHWTNSNLFIYWWSDSNTLFLASNDRTSNFEPNTVFITFTKLLTKLTQTSIFWTLNVLKHVQHLVIKFKHLIFDFEPIWV